MRCTATGDGRLVVRPQRSSLSPTRQSGGVLWACTCSHAKLWRVVIEHTLCVSCSRPIYFPAAIKVYQRELSMNEHPASAVVNKLIGKLLFTSGKVIASHRMMRAGRHYCRLGDTQATMADARAVIRRCMRRAAAASTSPRHTRGGSVISIR